MDTREEEGWMEEVTYSEVSKYKLYTDQKTWTAAEEHCGMNGGHLASVHSEEEQRKAGIEAGDEKYVWIGGSDQEEEGVWRWSDGSRRKVFGVGMTAHTWDIRGGTEKCFMTRDRRLRT